MYMGCAISRQINSVNDLDTECPLECRSRKNARADLTTVVPESTIELVVNDDTVPFLCVFQ